jgi:glycosyltransferase involved in cell wall biosynthesis
MSKYTELKEKYKGKRIILHVASYLSPMKGTDYAVEAMGYIVKEFPDALLLIITSDKNERRQAELFGLALKNKANISFIIGVKDKDMPSYYSLAEVLLAPSLDENVHLPQLEAQSCECPVITLRGKQPSEETSHGIGYVVDKKDLHSAVIDCLKYKREHHCRQFILGNFTWDKNIANYKRIISEVIS